MISKLTFAILLLVSTGVFADQGEIRVSVTGARFALDENYKGQFAPAYRDPEGLLWWQLDPGNIRWMEETRHWEWVDEACKNGGGRLPTKDEFIRLAGHLGAGTKKYSVMAKELIAKFCPNNVCTDRKFSLPGVLPALTTWYTTHDGKSYEGPIANKDYYGLFFSGRDPLTGKISIFRSFDGTVNEFWGASNDYFDYLRDPKTKHDYWDWYRHTHAQNYLCVQ